MEARQEIERELALVPESAGARALQRRLEATSPNCRTFGPLGGLRIWGPIVPGSYTVTETNPGPDWAVTISGSPAVVPPNRTAAALVTNSKTGAAIGVTKEGPPIALDGSAVGFTHQLAPRR